MSDTHSTSRAHNFVDLAGQTFGHLTVIRMVGRDPYRNITWECLCDCGETCVIRSGDLRSGNTKSCSCRQRLGMLSHNGSHTRLYWQWVGMHSRCYYQKHPSYAKYGGEGVVVCERWHDFENYRADVGERPTAQHSLDRWPNKFGNYEPNNVRWATRKEQARNTRTNRLITIGAITKSLAEWCEDYGMRYLTVHYRLRAGWMIEDAFGIPVSPTRKYPHKRMAPK